MSDFNPVKLTGPLTPTVETGRMSQREARKEPTAKKAVRITKRFTSHKDPFDMVEWEMRTAEIVNPTTGETVFREEDVEFPATWSQNCTALVAEKYFRHIEFEYTNGVTEIRKRKETSVKSMISRVADTITKWGVELGFFSEGVDSEAFNSELKFILLYQMAAFNSPVWFNVGTKRGLMREEQCSACMPYGVRVNTTQGLIPIGEIVRRVGFGEKFSTFDKDGKVTPIVNGICNGKRTVMRFVLSDGSVLPMTSNHRVFVRDGDELVEKLAGDLAEGDELVLSRDSLAGWSGDVSYPAGYAQDHGGVKGPVWFSEAVAWLAGAFVGNGYAGRPDSATSDIWEIKFSSKACVDRAASIMDSFGVPYTVKEFSWGYQIRGYGDVGRGFWEPLGLWNTAGDKRTPEWVMRAASSITSAYLQGLFDTDGSVALRDNDRVCVQLSNTSKQVIDTAHVLLRSMGIFATVRSWEDSDRDEYDRSECFVLSINDVRSVANFRELVGLTHEDRNERLQSAREPEDKDYKTASVKVVEKQRGGPELVYDIQTEAEVFWAEGILVHNCFINSVEDSMDSILELGETEGLLYKGGSGSGVNYSPLRSSREKLSVGGTSSGPVPFIAKDDSNAGAIKSGGGTRRAAKMAILNVDHGDILEFIRCKAHSEKAAHALIDAGFEGDFRARFGAYQLVPFQNANHSVRVMDEFMQAVEQDGEWPLVARDGSVLEVVKAAEVFDEICEAAHFCGDPGLQFDTTINYWHTCSETGRINSSNPCSEYMFLDDTACNLASINLVKFQNNNGSLDVEAFRHTVDVMITAMEIIVDGASYPTQKIQDNSHDFRPLGLGYTNLGAFFMNQGLSYDSDEARAQCGFITSLMTARAYRQSAKLADVVGPFPGYEENKVPMMQVMHQHRHANENLWGTQYSKNVDVLYTSARDDWNDVIDMGTEHGFRNSQATVLAPTGTISFLMDCDTTGIEPELSLVKMKKLVGGGTIKIVNQRVVDALTFMGYESNRIEEIEDYVLKMGSVVGSRIRSEDVAVFDSAFPDPVGGRYLRPEAHILMMAAAQPFLSGAISKTCNVPKDATKQDIHDLYVLAWKSGLKAVALYRDGSKRTQPLQAKDDVDKAEHEKAVVKAQPLRTKLPIDCMSLRHKFDIGGHEGYIHVGLYETGRPGEIFIKMAKEGSTVSGLMDAWGIQTSMSLQYGVPVEQIIEKFAYTSFEPSGWTAEPGIGHARSILDYVARWLEKKFVHGAVEISTAAVPEAVVVEEKSDSYNTGLACPSCGNTTQRTGACATCSVCGWNQGCG